MNITISATAEPIEGLIGGVIIGLAAALFLLGLGKIAGVSGITARVFNIAFGNAQWRISFFFIIGLILGGYLLQLINGPIKAEFPSSLGWLIAGGFLTGLGTRLAGGCTSGHGVCGMSRLSSRSLVAVPTFIASGIISVAIVNNFTGGW